MCLRFLFVNKDNRSKMLYREKSLFLSLFLSFSPFRINLSLFESSQNELFQIFCRFIRRLDTGVAFLLASSYTDFD